MTKGGPTPGGKARWHCFHRQNGERVYCYSSTDPTAGVMKQNGDVVRAKKKPIFKRALGGKTNFVVTAAQNGTPVHGPFLKALEQLCEHRNAELIVIPLRYKNPTSRWTASQRGEDIWAKELTPYLCNQRKKLNQNLVLLGDVKTQPTATSPLSGFEAITHGESGILGHTKLELRTVPTPQHRMAKILTTTGAVTCGNYTDTKAGKLGEFHHTLGAALVEVTGREFHLRQINAQKDTGEFIDLDDHFGHELGKVLMADRAQGLVLGDWHLGRHLKHVEDATFGPDGMVFKLRPKYILWHDLLDGYSVNPHHFGNPFNAIAKAKTGLGNVRGEVERCLEYVVKHTPCNSVSVIVPSNHNDFLRRWIESTDWKAAGNNAEFYLETALHMVRNTSVSVRGTEYPDAFTYWAKRLTEGSDLVRVLDRGESFTIGDIEAGLHFDKGPNGAKGSLKNLSRIGVKVIGGHGHGPGIYEGGTQVGTATGEQDYTTGSPSGWLNTHGSINALNKRCLHNIMPSGEWYGHD